MKSRNGLWIGFGAVIVLLVALPFLLPTGRFIPSIELLASEQLREPVRIASLKLHFLPLPHLSLHGIEVGKRAFLRVEKMRITPRLFALFDEQKVIREISLDGVTVGQQLIDKASGWIARGGRSPGPAPVRVEHISVRNASISLADFRLRQVDLDIALTPDGGVESAEVVADKRQVRAVLVPRGQQFALELSASNWRLPAGPALLLTSLKASGTLGPDGLVLPTIEGTLYDGTLAGKLAVGWKGDWTIGGVFEIRHVEIQPVVALFTKDTSISGRLDANPVIDMRAPSAGQLAELIDVVTDFRIEKGVLYKVDLSAAPKALLNEDAIKGGETRFDEFSGYLRVDQFGYQLSNLKISSGVLSAQGHLLISPMRELSGRIEAAVRGTASLVSTSLAVSGTVGDPVLRPTKSSLAGAAVGTALLGPGVGTAIGLKAAQLTERLFGGPSLKKRVPAKSAPATRPEGKPEAEGVQKPPAPQPATQEVPKTRRPTVTDSRR